MYLTQHGSPKQMFVLLRQLRLPVEPAASDDEAARESDLVPLWNAGMREYPGASPTALGQEGWE